MKFAPDKDCRELTDAVIKQLLDGGITFFVARYWMNGEWCDGILNARERLFFRAGGEGSAVFRLDDPRLHVLAPIRIDLICEEYWDED